MSNWQSFAGTCFIPLGGVGEFGANAAIVSSGGTQILVDYGMMFPPDQRQPGVDFYIHDSDLLFANFPNLSAVFLTHGHEDHIGGLAHLMAVKPLPLYALPYPAKLICGKLPEAQRGYVRTVQLNQPQEHGDLSVTYIGVTHSILEAAALWIQTPTAGILHSGDFKVDPLPNQNQQFQSAELAALGRQGVDLLVMDSTNATKPGFCPSETEVMPAWEAAIADARGRVFFTTFSSHMPRLSRLAGIAARHNRKIAIMGASLERHLQAAKACGYLERELCQIIELEQAARLAEDELIVVLTGSQGENQAALTRMLKEPFKGWQFMPGDTVIFAAKPIPGNERQVALRTSAMERMGVRVITAKDAAVHTSGHAYREELAYLLNLTQPRTAAPIHGEYHQLLEHQSWLYQLTQPHQQVLFLEDGMVCGIKDGQTHILGSVPTQLVPMDGNQALPLSRTVLKERKDMMYSGLIVVSAVSQPSGGLVFEIDCHGMAETKAGSSARKLLQALEDFVPAHEDPRLVAIQIEGMVKKALRVFFNGRPFLKIILDGRILK